MAKGRETLWLTLFVTSRLMSATALIMSCISELMVSVPSKDPYFFKNVALTEAYRPSKMNEMTSFQSFTNYLEKQTQTDEYKTRFNFFQVDATCIKLLPPLCGESFT